METEEVYEIELSFSEEDSMVQGVLFQLSSWRKEYGEECVNYIYEDRKKFATIL
jgi:hypothetical protein